MRLMSVRDYIDLNFVGNDKPTPKTIKNWIDKGILPGKKLGGKFWVDLSQESTGNNLADQILGIGQ
ncbi:MAG: hypothetical protein KZQ83_14720 [gamma proteobacterium symbiont of Taylorina sp.]|nr:hypothetical protein [gamma proteobacterium symbiont of Taylorina sp.]